MEQDKITMSSLEARSRGSWVTDPVTLHNKLHAKNGKIIEAHLNNNYHKQAHAVWEKNKVRQ